MADGNTGQGNSLDTISIRITASATTAARSVDQLTNSLTNLRNAVSGSLSGLSSLSASLGSLSASLTNLRTATEGVGNLRNSLRGLSGIDLTNVTNSMRELANLDFNANGIRAAVQDLQGLTQQVTGLSEAIRGVPNFNLRGMEQLNGQFRSGANRASRFSSVLGGLKGAVTAIVSSQLIGAMKQMIGSTNDYIEAMNLARVSLGDYADEAVRFGETVSGALGIDQGTLLENMGLFQNLSTSFGVSADNAYILSKNMAQLAYDFASFHNLDLEESFLKFQSALAGELEPIRRVGVDISNARLQQELYDLGLKQSISTLGRADKAVLTYIAIMKQSANEMGDMARTIQSPANMLRVLGNQATITGRQIGALFIPALQEILPWAIAVMKVIGQLASTLASLAGFNMEDYLADVDGSAFEGMAGDIEDVGTAAGKAAKQMNNLIGGFDELNILKKARESAGTGVMGGNLLDNIDLSKYQYDMLEGLVPTDDLVNQVYDAVDCILEPFRNINFENTVQRFKDFFAKIKEQAAAFDWGKLGSGLWESLVGVFGAVSELASRIVLPNLEALNIPAVVFTGYSALKDALWLVKEAIDALTPGFTQFVETAVVPIVGWVGEKLVDAFSWLSEQIKVVGGWFDSISPLFTAFAEKVATLVSHLWDILEPIGNSLWDGFKSTLEKIGGVIGSVIEVTIAFAGWIVNSANKVIEFVNVFGIFDRVKIIAKNVIESTIGLLNGLLSSLKGTLDFLTGVFSGDWDKAWDGIKQTLSGIVDVMISILQMFFGNTADEISNWFNNDIKVWFTAEKWKQMGRTAIDSLFNAIKSAASKIKNFFADLFNFDSLFTKYSPNMNNDYRTPGSVRSVSVPAFASGNVATDPTLALFGEYPGAKSNPEITAPQSTIYETVVAANGEMVNAVYQMATMIVQAIESNSTEISVDSRGLFKAVKKEASAYQKSHGVPAF